MREVALGPEDVVPARGFADPSATARDVALLEEIREALRRRLATGAAEGTWRDPSGDGHLLVIPDVVALETAVPAVAVGFFGQARTDVDHTPIVELEHALLRRAAEFRGLLAYHDVQFRRQGQWGNLVVFATADDVSALAMDPEHRVSIDLTAAHYRSLRLHRFALPDGALGPGALRWLRTTYLDFADDPPWRAVRRITPSGT